MYIGKRGSIGNIMLWHFADANIVRGLRERRDSFYIFINLLKILFVQVGGQIAAQYEIFIVQKVHIMDRKGQVIQVGLPALCSGRVSGGKLLEEGIFIIVSEQCTHGTNSLGAALLSAVAFPAVRDKLDMFDRSGISMLAGQNPSIIHKSGTQMDTDVHIDEVRQFRGSMETASEGGAWGIALLAAYLADGRNDGLLEEYLDKRVFSSLAGDAMEPDPAEVDGFECFTRHYIAGLEAEKAAIRAIDW